VVPKVKEKSKRTKSTLIKHVTIAGYENNIYDLLAY